MNFIGFALGITIQCTCYTVDSLANLLQADFEVRSFEIQDHVTPTGTVQQFLYAWWQART